MYDTLTDIELLALVLYLEARSEGLDGMLAVASVIMNRANHPSWWGHDIRSVILKPKQFSCLNEADPQADRVKSIVNDFESFLISSKHMKYAHWIAKGMIEGRLPSNIGGATHYHTQFISPEWAKKMNKLSAIGNHIFYS